MRPGPDADFARHWAPERAAGVELFCATVLRHAFSKHVHEADTIGLNDEGGAFWCAGAEREATPGGST
jgi:hypothetical protein